MNICLTHSNLCEMLMRNISACINIIFNIPTRIRPVSVVHDVIIIIIGIWTRIALRGIVSATWRVDTYNMQIAFVILVTYTLACMTDRCQDTSPARDRANKIRHWRKECHYVMSVGNFQSRRHFEMQIYTQTIPK